MTMKPVARRAAAINIGGNLFLMVIKFWAAYISSSIAVLSDAFNSLLDGVAAVAIYICVVIAEKEADQGHPFGHSRAEPVAGLLVAILAGMLGFEIIRDSIKALYVGSGDSVVVTGPVVYILLLTLFIKMLMAYYFINLGKKIHSPALKATGVDSALDVGITVTTLAGIAGVYYGYNQLDAAAGILISFWILYTGYHVAMENIDYLMGSAPSDEMIKEIRDAAMKVEGVIDTNTIKAHYVGSFIHVEFHIDVESVITTAESHDIGVLVEEEIEKIPAVQKAFIHIDPIDACPIEKTIED